MCSCSKCLYLLGILQTIASHRHSFGRRTMRKPAVFSSLRPRVGGFIITAPGCIAARMTRVGAIRMRGQPANAHLIAVIFCFVVVIVACAFAHHCCSGWVASRKRLGAQSHTSSAGMWPNIAQQRRQWTQSAQVLPSGKSISGSGRLGLRRIGWRSVLMTSPALRRWIAPSDRNNRPRTWYRNL